MHIDGDDSEVDRGDGMCTTTSDLPHFIAFGREVSLGVGVWDFIFFF